MKCETCKGEGQVLNRRAERPGVLPCPSCNGTGQQSCCEGMVGNASDVTNTGGSDNP